MSARRGLEIAVRIGDAVLESAGLDALASAVTQRGSWREGREINRARLRLADRLDLTERLDAHNMITWAGCLLGDLDEAIRVSASILPHVQPGQVPAAALGLASWRTYALSLRGSWDEALESAERAFGLWVESGRIPAGYALRGFTAGLEVARARRDERPAERCAEAIDAITREFADDTVWHRRRAFLAGCAEVAAAGLVSAGLAGSNGDLVEQAVGRCADGGCILDVEVLRPVIARAAELGFAPLEAQARRALGIALGDAGELGRAAAMFGRVGMVPCAARAHCEHAVLVGDGAELDAGLAVLDRLGDLEATARYRRRG